MNENKPNPTFTVGQKVKCVDARGTFGGLVQGGTYTISNASKGPSGRYVEVEEVGGGDNTFFHWRFAAIPEDVKPEDVKPEDVKPATPKPPEFLYVGSIDRTTLESGADLGDVHEDLLSFGAGDAVFVYRLERVGKVETAPRVVSA